MKSTAREQHLTVGEVAGRFGLRGHVLRHWETIGLLAPGRTSGGARRYDDADLYRVAVILRGKEAGLSLEQIAAMLSSDGPRRRAVLQKRREELIRKVAAVQASVELIDCALGCDHDDIADCSRFRDLITSRVADTVPAQQH